MIKIYLSGQITGTDDYMKRFATAEDRLTEQGYIVFNPAKVNAQMPKETTYEGYMEVSKAILMQCDAIYMLKGFELSNGATLEMQWALNKGMMFMFEDTSYVKDTFLLANKAQMDNMYAYSIGGK